MNIEEKKEIHLLFSLYKNAIQKMKKKKIIISIGMLILFIMMILSFMFIDLHKLKNQKEPIFSINTINYRDGGSKEYIGLGYKIIKYHNNTKNYFEVGTWFLRYE